jgi:anaerobic selenocysteine-containing dehydrogenase
VSPLYKRPRSARPLRVEQFLASRVSDAERGPQVRMRADDAVQRLVQDGELVWVEGPRRQQLATLVVDDSVPRGGVILRDVAGVAPSELIYIIKPDLDAPQPSRELA